MPANRILFCLLLSFVFFACQDETNSSKKADTILVNGDFYTVNADQSRVQAVAISGQKIMALGDSAIIAEWSDDSTNIIDLSGAFAMPGFVEGHAHFSGLGSSLRNLNFLKSRSWEEIVAMVAEQAKTAKKGVWIMGRGWHQEKWDKPHDHSIGGYPLHDLLSEVSPDNPVILRHASGHSLFANKKAMEMAGINTETPDPRGGHIVRDANGDPIGVFEERAMDLITGIYQEYLNSLSEEERKTEWLAGIAAAQQECLSKGVTSFQDAGSTYREIAWYKELAENGELDLRLWAMLRHSFNRMNGNMDDLPMVDVGDKYFTCRAIKTEVDGALGAFGAWLLEPYDDIPGFVGQNTTEVATVDSIAGLALQHEMQLCIHAIGDRANREVLDLIEERFKTTENGPSLRWRMEHSQHLHPDDIPRFKELGVIASMQAIHCTSDAPFVVKRLGEKRAREGAYPWRSLLDAGAVVTNGTDAPVEDVDPIESFYASVTRKRADTGLEFFPEQAMTREEAVYSYTMAPAYAGFEENDKGSLEVGKLADIVVLSNDLLTCADEEIMDTEVLMTFVGGELKYEKE